LEPNPKFYLLSALKNVMQAPENDGNKEKREYPVQVTSFEDLGLGDELLRAVHDVGYETPTPIQEKAIPYVLQMRDVLGCAQTGTGKTAGFTLPMIEILSTGRAKARMPRSLILEPTRELAAQVAENFTTYGKYHKLNMALLIGGETMTDQIANLDRGVDVLIATPGRMLDLFERGKIILRDIKIFVIDEADRMLDMGFIPDVEKIAGLLPPMHQTLFFSATMPPEIRKLADRFLSNPKTVTVAPPASTSGTIKQSLLMLPTTDDWQKREALRILLKRETVQNAFIFCNRKRDVALLDKSLKRHGFNAGALHGDMEQSERMATLDRFKSGEITFLVCSDVAARGLDVPDVSHVFNFDVPFNAEDYVHRIGRTGRAGKLGTSITLVTPDDDKQLADIESLIKIKIDRETIKDLPEPDVSRRAHRQPRHLNRHSPRPHHVPVPHKEQPLHQQQASVSQREQAPRQERPVAAPRHQDRPLAAPRQTPAKIASESATGFGDNVPAFLRRKG
jgi:superfamily II DNA/RNA helicase